MLAVCAIALLSNGCAPVTGGEWRQATAADDRLPPPLIPSAPHQGPGLTAPPGGGPGGPGVPGDEPLNPRRALAAPPALGVQFHGTWNMYYSPAGSAQPNAMFTRHLDALENAKVSLVRVDIGWSASQPDPGEPSLRNTYNRRIEQVLDAAHRRGMQVLITVHQSPAWSRPGTGTDVKQFPDDPDLIRPWATWLGRTWGDRVAAWEIWNEPNLSEFTGIDDPTRRAERYVPLLRAASAGLRAGHRGAEIVFGAPAQVDDGFIESCYRLGARPYFDIMAVHPYQGNQTKPPESADITGRARMTHFPALVRVMSEHGDEHKPVWWTEFGFSVHSNDEVDPDTKWLLGLPDGQTSGDYLRRSFELARVRYPQVRVAVVYTAYSTEDSRYGHKEGYRLLRSDGQPMPQLGMLSSYMARFPGHRPLT